MKYKTLEDIEAAKFLISHPGETLIDTIDAKDISQTELASRMGRPIKTINEIIQGRTAITPETAAMLKGLVGQTLMFDNGQMVGTQFSISTEDRVDMNAKEAFPPRTDLRKQGCSEGFEEAIYRQPFLRGAKVWVGGQQTGVVLFVSVYKNSFKLWMGNFQNV